MPRLRTWLAGLAVFAMLAVLAVWQVPQFLDWTRFRATIEVLASVSLGQPVSIHGPISLTLLPQPVLTAAQVNVSGSGQDDLSIHVDALRLRVALWPLLAGRVDARELVLRGPDLRIPWPADPVLRARPPYWLAAVGARIENGRLAVGRLAFTGIDATLTTLETGALAASGTARFNGEQWHVTARLTASGADGAAGLNVTLDGQGRAGGLGASFTGQLAADGSLAGRIGSRGPNLSILLPAPPVPFRADGRLTVAGGLTAIDDLALEVAGSPASGAVSLRVAPQRRLDIALSASRLDLNAWLPVLLGASATVAGINVSTGLDFSVESAPFGGGILQHLRAAFDLAGNALTVREASALLPGNGRLQITGRVTRDDPAHARFEGDARLDAPVLRATLRWLEEAAPGVLPTTLIASLPEGVLQRAALAAHVVASGGEVMLSKLDGKIDDAPVSGGLGLKRGEPLAIAANLAFEQLSLDPWLPHRLPAPGELARFALGFDAELRLRIRTATLAGTVLHDVSVDAVMEAGSLALRRIEASSRGVQMVASGSVGENGRMSDGLLTLATRDAAPIADWVPSAWRATPALWNGPARLEMQAAGPPDALALGIRLSLADAQLDASPTVDLRSGKWSATMMLRHPGARRLLATLGLPERMGLTGLPTWLGDGSLSIVAHLAGAPGRIGADSIDVTAAAFRADGRLMLDQTGAEPRIGGRINVDTLQIPVPNGSSEMPLPLDLLRGWQCAVSVHFGSVLAASQTVLRNASATVSVANATLRLEQVSAKLGGGTLSGSFLFDAAASPPALVSQTTLTNVAVAGPLADAPLDLLSGTVAGRLDLSASGYSPATLLATLAGRVALTMTDGAVSGFDLERAKLAAEKTEPVSAKSEATDALGVGASGFDSVDIAANLTHGELLIETAQLHAGAGEADVTGSINLPSGTLDLRIVLRPALPNPPEIAIRLTGPIDHLNRTPELAGLARFVAERAH